MAGSVPVVGLLERVNLASVPGYLVRLLSGTPEAQGHAETILLAGSSARGRCRIPAGETGCREATASRPDAITANDVVSLK